MQAPPATPTQSDEPPPETVQEKKAGHKITLILENSGSVARDHLASERTFLAYVRTSLTIASAGVALVQLFSLTSSTPARQSFARPLGAATILFGLAVLAIGVGRYFTVQGALTQGKFPVARVLVATPAVILCILVTIIFGFVMSNHR